MTKKELLAEIERLKARIAELEAQKQSSNAHGFYIGKDYVPCVYSTTVPYTIRLLDDTHVGKYEISYEQGSTRP